MSYSNLLQPNQSSSTNLHANSLTLGSGSISLFNQLELNQKLALLLPRLTTVERNLLTPISGQMLFNTTTNQVEVYQSGSWAPSSGPPSAATIQFDIANNFSVSDMIIANLNPANDLILNSQQNVAINPNASFLVNTTVGGITLAAGGIGQVNITSNLISSLAGGIAILRATGGTAAVISTVGDTNIVGDQNVNVTATALNVVVQASVGDIILGAAGSIQLGAPGSASHLVNKGLVPALSAAAGFTVGPTIEVDSTDTCGQISGTTAIGLNTVVVTFNVPYPVGSKPIVMLTAGDSFTATMAVSAVSNAGFTLNVTTAGAVAAVVNYMVMANSA